MCVFGTFFSVPFILNMIDQKTYYRIWEFETSRGKYKNTSRYRYHQELSEKDFNSPENNIEK